MSKAYGGRGRWQIVVIILVLLAAAFTRFHRLGTQSLWNDEGNSLRLAQRHTGDLIDAAGRDIHPPGYYLALKWWIAGVGESEWGLRSLSALVGILTVAVTIALGQALFSRGAGIVAGVLVALSPFAVYYSQETRMYAPLGLFSALSIWSLVRWLLVCTPRTPDRRVPSHGRFWLALLIASNIAGLYTHYSFPFTMIAQGLIMLGWLVERRSDARLLWESLIVYVSANLVAILVFAPWLPTAWDQITSWPSTGVELAIIDQVRTVITWLTVGSTSPLTSDGLLLIVMLAWLAPLLLYRWHQRPSYGWRIMVPVWWSSIVIGSLLVSGAYREANLKFLLPAQVAGALVLGQGAIRLRRYVLFEFSILPETVAARRSLASVVAQHAVSLVGMLVVGGVIAGQVAGLHHLYTDPAYARDDYRAMAVVLKARTEEGDAIILDAPNQIEVFSYYYDGPATIYELPRGLGGDDAQTRTDVLNVIGAHRRIYVLFWGEDERDPNRIVQTTLDTAAYPVSSAWYGNVRLAQYAVLNAPATVPNFDLAARFGHAITLAGYTITPELIRPGDVIGVTLFWTTDRLLDTRYKVTVQLLAPDGSLVTQHDAEPGGNRVPTIAWLPGAIVTDTHGLIVPPDRAPGRYTIIVGVYPLSDPTQRLRVVVDDADPTDALVLTEILLE